MAESGHWYQTDGTPRYEATLREARKELLLPSVTTILRVKDKGFQLEQYIKRQITQAAREIDPQGYGGWWPWHEAVLERADLHRKTAAETGDRWHDYLTRYCRDRDPFPAGADIRDDELPLLAPAVAWIDANLPADGEAEGSAVNLELGYAGRVDYRCPAVMVDIKTTGSVKDADRGPYWGDDWCPQLVAYQACAEEGKGSDKLISLAISTNPALPGAWAREWTTAEQLAGWEMFRACLVLWRLVKGLPYSPPADGRLPGMAEAMSREERLR